MNEEQLIKEKKQKYLEELLQDERFQSVIGGFIFESYKLAIEENIDKQEVRDEIVARRILNNYLEKIKRGE